ncbi:MAG TPA: DUF2723 domain-containing protein [Gemmatimonadales bacterium]|nr:DUF2723 domain-containing protein [Gemmatimonadales bacterium]
MPWLSRRRCAAGTEAFPIAAVTRRPPYRLALVASLLVLAGYVATLAPTVTFWDAGEFIAAAKSLGIPHPPGTPLFVMLAHVWAALVPLAEYAQRTNLLSAVLSAAGAGFLFLVAHETLTQATTRLPERSAAVLRSGGAFAAALIGAFSFTAWQNSNETEVYAAATCTISLLLWLVLLWRRERGGPRAPRLLLLMVYLAGLSIGNHLLALLAGPAVVAFVASVCLTAPAAGVESRRSEWVQLGVVAAVWSLLVATGLGSTSLILVAGLCVVAAAVVAARGSNLSFAAAAVAVAAIGVTTYLFLYLRAAQHPVVNEADPETWSALLAVIRRAQYPVRTPLDDPTVLHGPDNPGRTFAMFGLQLVNYIQYFDWQWANGIERVIRLGAVAFPVRTFVSLGFAALGARGLFLQRQVDRSAWWLLFMLWLVTGVGLIVYMNFKPGYSMGYDTYPDPADHEVRDRDYFFVVSFVIWGLWAGLGAFSLVRDVLARRGRAMVRMIALAAIALVPFAGNLAAATRRQGPDVRLAADFAYDLLNSVPPYGILFTLGDNDTFPLWWAQEVEGVRRDVLVVCLALAETDWYKRELRDLPARAFDSAAAPPIWQGRLPSAPTNPPLDLSDQEIAALVPQQTDRDISIPIGPVTTVLRKGTPLYTRDIAVLRILQENLGRRPIAWSLTTGRHYYGLDPYLLQQGLVMALQRAPVDTTSTDVDRHRILGLALDVPTTDRLLWETYRYGGLLGATPRALEPTAAGIANDLALPFTQLAYAYQQRGDLERARRNLERAGRLSDSPGLSQALLPLLRQPGGSVQEK